MASISISELRPSGAELFQDSESFLNDLTDLESVQFFGGRLIITGHVVVDWSWGVKIDIVVSGANVVAAPNVVGIAV
jgi:hypothetical protein